MKEKHRFIVLGTGALFTCKVLEALVSQGHRPLAYIQFTPHIHQHSGHTTINTAIAPRVELTTLLKSNAIELYYQPQDGLAELIRGFRADFMLVACWPELLSDNILTAVNNAALNLHPSLLPKFRGPDPVQAQLDSDDNDFGVSLHIMNAQFDAGDIVLQHGLNVKELDKPAIESVAAEQGAQLFIRAMNTYSNPGWTLSVQN